MVAFAWNRLEYALRWRGPVWGMEKNRIRMQKPKAGLTLLLKRFKDAGGRLTVLTGAGISAESGIPTFRGPEGYWTVGSKEYRPEEMATHSMFSRDPWEVWAWYLYRRTVCKKAEPNTGHLAIVEMEKLFGDRFRLITQNVDGLHLDDRGHPLVIQFLFLTFIRVPIQIVRLKRQLEGK